MKLSEILKKVGTSVFKEVVPGGDAVIEAINYFLPADKKLDASKTTGAGIELAISQIPAPERAALLAREFDFEIVQVQEQYSALRAMLEADFKTPHTTRPKIAYGSFQILAAVSLIVISIWAYGAATGDTEILRIVVDGWPFIIALIGPFVTLLYAYFGVLRTEHRQRLNAAQGLPTGGLTDSIKALLKR